MRPAAEGLKQLLNEVTVKPFSVGVVTNVEAAVNWDFQRVKALLTEQTVRPVRWEESIRKLDQLGCQQVWEVGPGKVLRGLIKRISASLEVENFSTPQDLARVATEQRP